MARRKTLQDLIDDLEPAVRAAFLASIQNIKGDAILSDIVSALKRGDIDAALSAIPLKAEYLAPLDRAMREAYADGGEWSIDGFRSMARAQGAQISVRFNPRNPRAESFTAAQANRRVTEVLETTKADLRALMVRRMAENTTPNTVGLDIVGRINKVTGVRSGGLVGQHSQDIETIERVRRMLSDPDEIGKYFVQDSKTGKLKPRYKTTSRQFDSKVRRAIAEGRALSAKDIASITRHQSNKLLKLRGERIARTELLSALSHAEDEGLAQLIGSGSVRSDQVSSAWDAAEDDATRPSHAAMDGQVRPYGVPFDTGDGYQMLFPGDRSLGAPAKEIIQCRCARRIDIDFIAGLNRGD